MQTFTGQQYIKIAAANALGLDQENWDTRILLGSEYLDKPIDEGMAVAKEPHLYAKAWYAQRDAETGTPTGYIMPLDATASGPQIIACLMGCEKTALRTNLVNTGKREDLYNFCSHEMNNRMGSANLFDRKRIKTPLMATLYGSIQEPINLLGQDTPEYFAYYEMIAEELPGCKEYMDLATKAWRSYQENHSWTLPDGHTAFVPVTDSVAKRVEVDELNHATFTLIKEEVVGKQFGITLIANIIHSIDGYVVREMVRRCFAQGFEILCIHDSFWCSPNHMNKLRRNYMEILSEIAASNLLSEIFTEIVGKPIQVVKQCTTLPLFILESEYTLS